MQAGLTWLTKHEPPDSTDKSISNSDHDYWFRFILRTFRDKVIHFISLYVPDVREREEPAAVVFVTL